MPRIFLVHATRVAIQPIEAAARLHWPDVETVSLLEEGLAIDRRRTNEVSSSLHARIEALTTYAESADADGVLFTCSAFGSAIEAAAAQRTVPVMKPNEAMFAAAFGHGPRIAMIYTFAPAAGGMELEFQEAARARHPTAQLTSYYCEGALSAKQCGNEAEHDRLVAETASRIVDADAIMLAQFSMASAAARAQATCAVPVLTSPDAAMLEMRRRVTQMERFSSC